HPWDKRDDEPPAAYQRFWAYLSLGRSRSIDAAAAMAGRQKVSKGIKRASGQWRRDCHRYAWVNRAAAYDAHQLRTVGQKAAVLYVEGICCIAERVKEATGELRIKTVREVIQVLRFLSEIIPQETVAALCHAEGHGEGTGREVSWETN